jgi:hypothetical protein
MSQLIAPTADGQIAHQAIFIKKELIQVAWCVIKPDASSNYSFPIGLKWFSPVDLVDFEGSQYRLTGKTKRGFFRYESVNGD